MIKHHNFYVNENNVAIFFRSISGRPSDPA